ncbi:MAG: 6-carboxytetrahydropterin synthase [Myxococcota bacterium]|nr:6-carboxytetrahydropterin synthase [Myxococcota bacterium]
MIYSTRCYRFSAAHVLAHPELDSAENERIFGKCANPGGHGHDYEVQVSVAGPIDPESGQIIRPGLLDEIFRETIETRFAHRMLNEVEPFDRIVPTAENISETCQELLEVAIARRSSAELAHIRIIETEQNFVDQGEL